MHHHKRIRRRTLATLTKFLPLWIVYFSTLVRVLKCDINDEKPNVEGFCAEGELKRICIPKDYMKYELPSEEGAVDVSIGVDIKDIPNVNDQDFSITLNAYFITKWHDKRLSVTKRNRTRYQPRNESSSLFEKDRNVINIETRISSTTPKVINHLKTHCFKSKHTH